ncbi:lipoprotein [Halobacteriovorax sp. GB3]|uniref:lipoprotein n=1 Tax=Halobacteriovorax sp. GB3 TaxID=2719615 RepID=UPI00235F86E9|nr:lipoprotein [Halobacteriovorax sp. GB3]MDD0852948.1 lipoprotein [Halobacteriovorax sp. GB3]
MKKTLSVFFFLALATLASCSTTNRKPASSCEEPYFVDQYHYFDQYERCNGY